MMVMKAVEKAISVPIKRLMAMVKAAENIAATKLIIMETSNIGKSKKKPIIAPPFP